MMDNNEYIIREHIIKLLAHKLTLEQFRRWFSTSEASLAEHEIVHNINLLFAEYDHGDWTEQGMSNLLRDELEHVTIDGKTSAQIETGTSSTTMEYVI